MKLTIEQLEQGQIARDELMAQSEEDQNCYGIFLAKLEDIKTEFIRAATEAHPTDAAAFVQALVIRNEATKLARAEYLTKTSIKNEEGQL